MKVLFLSDKNARHTIKWVNSLANSGCEVYLVSLKTKSFINNKINDKVKIIDLPIRGLKGYYLNSLFLRKIVSRINPDVINTHYASGYGTLARKARLKNNVISVWGSDVYDFPYKNKLSMSIIKKNLLSAKKITSTSYCMAKQVIKLIGNQDIKVIPFGVDIDKFKSYTVKNRGDFFRIGTIKALENKYGIDISIRGVSKFIESLPVKDRTKIKYEIYGDGSKKEDLKKLIEDLGMTNNIEIMGLIKNDDVPKVLNSFNVFVSMSQLDSESFGVAVVEAMACKVPVIASDVDGFKEVTDNGECAYVIERSDYRQLALLLRDMYYNPGNYDKLEIAYEKVLKEYDWNKNVNQMIETYKHI